MKIDTIPTEFEVLDERFRSVNGDGRVERFDLGARWLEGPVYVPAGRYLLVSDIPNDRVLRWDEPTGAIGVFRQPAGYTNGHTLDARGRLISCEHGNRRVTRTEHDGSITVLADRHDGRRLNSPNDAVVRSDGSVWFTDPSYGIDSDYEGHRADSEIGACHVYRIDPGTGTCEIVADDFVRPNGLAFSLDEAQLYVADSRANHIRVFEVSDDATLSGGRVFATGTDGVFDGLRLDDTGRVWAAAGDGVHCFDPDGTRTTSFWEPVTTMLEGAGASSYSYLLDFLILWVLFAFAFGILRAVTDTLSPTKVTFDMPVEMAGRSLLALWCAWLVVCFAAFSLQMAPLNSPTPLGAWSTPTSPTFLVTSPDRLWLGFMHSRSKGAFSSGQVFDPAAEFALKYRDRRIKYAQASDMRVAP